MNNPLIKSLLFFILYCMIIFAIQVVAYIIMYDVYHIPPKHTNYCNTISFAIMLPIVYVIYYKYYRTIPKITYISLGILLISSALILLGTDLLLPYENTYDDTRKDLLQKIYYIITIVVLAPFLEEIFFRGIIFKMIREKYSLGFSIIYTSILFSLVHFYKFTIHLDFLFYIIHIFVFSVVVTFIYAKTCNIYYVIGFHMFYNLCTYIIRYVI